MRSNQQQFRSELHTGADHSSSSSSKATSLKMTTEAEKASFTVFITGLSFCMKRKGLIDFFKSIYPSTVNFTPKRLGRNKRVPGFGFLLLGSEKEAQDALRRKTFSYEDKELKAEPYLNQEDLKTQKDDFEKRKVYVGKIPRKLNSTVLKEAMEKAFGSVEKAYIILNSSYKRKNRKGFGYVIFNTEASAKRAIDHKLLEIASFKAVLILEKLKQKNPKKNQKGGSDKKKQESEQKGSRELRPEPRLAQNPEEGQFGKPVSSPSAEHQTESPNHQMNPEASQMSIIPVRNQGRRPNPRQHQTPQNEALAPGDRSKEFNRGFNPHPTRPFFLPQNSQKSAILIKNQRRPLSGNLGSQPNASRNRQYAQALIYFAKQPSPRPLRFATRGRRGLPHFEETRLEEAVSKTGWKEYCLERLNHHPSNIRINLGRLC